MDDMLYDDKLAGDISADKYAEKHKNFTQQKTELAEQLSNLDSNFSKRFDQRLTMLELSQKAAQIYANGMPDQKRLIISKLFAKLTIKKGAVSVTYTNFASIIAQNVLEITNLMETKK